MKKVRRILINDDDPDFNKMMAWAFKKKGFEIETTTHCDDALKYVEKNCPDLIVTDINMPGMKGDEFIAELRKRKILVPVIAVSGHVSLKSENYIFFAKPFSQREVVDFIDSYFDEITHLQLIKNVAAENKIDDTKLGYVISYYQDRGWGLLRVIGKDDLIYVNSADINSGQKFNYLCRGQVVSYDLNEKSPRGPRAENVEVMYGDFKERFAKKKG